MGTKFHTSEPNGSEEETFKIFPLYFNGSFEQTWSRTNR